jgi:hypothetical protein
MRNGIGRGTVLACFFAVALVCLAPPQGARAQTFVLKDRTADEVMLEANAAVAMVGLITYPDITTSSISIDSGRSDDTALLIGQIGDGFTVSDEFPLYLEGVIGFGRYDPSFVATAGAQEQTLPLKWTTVAATGGIGWDFPVAENLALRPIANFTLAHIETDLSVAGRVIESGTGAALDFLQNGRANIVGFGGAIVLDYERYLDAYEIDVELRYSRMRLETFDGGAGIQGAATVITAGLWSRYREPTGIEILRRPLRYVLEFAHSEFIGDQGDALGVDRLSSIGAGLEIDLSDVNNLITRTRLIGRYLIGSGSSGISIGLGISF